VSTSCSAESVLRFVQDWISGHAKKATHDSEIDSSANFVAAGIIDSMAFVRLLMDTENEYGLQLDFSELDPSEFLSIDGFTSCVVKCLEEKCLEDTSGE